MAAVASEPGAAAAASVSLSAAELRPADHSQEHRDLPPLPLSLCEPPLASKEHEERRQEREKSGANEANEELTLTLQDCSEANANANAELMLQESLPPSDPEPVQAAVSPLSLPAALEAPEAPEGGLSLGQPNGPARACTDMFTDRSQRRSGGGAEGGHPGPPETESSPELRPETDSSPELRPETDSSSELRPGTHVRVSLDHVIDDALVVSFRVGNKVFSGVLMDLTHRFGPFGIPITVFPPRRESSRRHVQATPPPAAEALPPPEALPPDPALTPLFHQGAPYPPPLFLRDSYHTLLPQPPPRRIKRSRRRYGNSEEPTCMLVRLRPRQVLCDRCKGAAGPKAPPVSTRRRCAPDPPEENLSAEVKRLRCDDRPPRARREGPKGATPTPQRRLDHRESRDSAHRESRDSAHRESRDSAHRESRDSAHRESRDSAHSERSTRQQQQSRVLTRRLNSALTPPRIRLKPHRAESVRGLS